MDTVKGFLSNMKRVWLGYHPYLRLFMLVMLGIAFIIGVLGSIGYLDSVATWWRH